MSTKRWRRTSLIGKKLDNALRSPAYGNIIIVEKRFGIEQSESRAAKSTKSRRG